MAKSLIEVNTDTALDLSNEIEKITTRFNSFLRTIESKDKQQHLMALESNKQQIKSEYKDIVESRKAEIQSIIKPKQPLIIPEEPQPKQKEESFDLGKLITTAAALGVPGFGGLFGEQEEGLPPTGENGRMKPEQLIAVGSLTSDPVGGPYWYGRTAYLRKSDAGPAFLQAKAAAAKSGVNFVINSAYRSIEHQKALQGLYDVVATPGFSPHGDGIALDIQTGTAGWNWLVKNGMKYGWKWMNIPRDEVHFEYVGGGSSPIETQRRTNVPTQPPASKSGKPTIILQQQNQSSIMIPQSSNLVASSLNTNSGIPLEQVLFTTV